VLQSGLGPGPVFYSSGSVFGLKALAFTVISTKDIKAARITEMFTLSQVVHYTRIHYALCTIHHTLYSYTMHNAL
jgi:hypothetical protein